MTLFPGLLFFSYDMKECKSLFICTEPNPVLLSWRLPSHLIPCDYSFLGNWVLLWLGVYTPIQDAAMLGVCFISCGLIVHVFFPPPLPFFVLLWLVCSCRGYHPWSRKWLSFVLFVFPTSFADSLGMQMDAHMYTPVNKILLLKSLVVATARENLCSFSWLDLGWSHQGYWRRTGNSVLHICDVVLSRTVSGNKLQSFLVWSIYVSFYSRL